MAFTAKPSEGLAPRLEGLLAEGEQIIFCLDSDIGPDGDYGEQSLILTDKRLGVLPPNGEADPRFFDIESVEEAKAEVLVGSGLVLMLYAWWRFEERDIRVAGEGGWRLPGLGRRATPR